MVSAFGQKSLSPELAVHAEAGVAAGAVNCTATKLPEITGIVAAK